MARRMLFPKEALDDVSAVLQLSEQKLSKLAALIDEYENPADMIYPAAEGLELPLSTAHSIVSVATFFRSLGAQLDPDTDVLQDVRKYLEEYSTEVGREDLLDKFDRRRETLQSIIIPSAKWVRRRKIRQLANGPQATLDSCRTICQLRPLFEHEDDDDDETIAGLVSNVLVEINLSDPNDNEQSVVFNLDPEKLDELIAVFTRTQAKMLAISERYNVDLLNSGNHDENG